MEGRSAGPEGQGGCFDSPSLGPLDSLPTRNDQGGALDPKAESRSGRLAEKALYCASEVLRIAFSGRHPPCAPIVYARPSGAPAQRSQRNHDLYIHNENNETPLFWAFRFFRGFRCFRDSVGGPWNRDFVDFVEIVLFGGYREIVISLKSLVSWFSGGTVKPLKSLIPLGPLRLRGHAPGGAKKRRVPFSIRLLVGAAGFEPTAS